MPLNLTVNGDVRQLDPAPAPSTLDAVVTALGHDPRLVVVEHNGVIPARRLWATTTVVSDDTLEIVTIVGGGS